MRLYSKNVLIDGEFKEASMLIEDGIIKSIDESKEGVDFSEFKIAPGIVDLHSDALEKEIEPRPGANFNPKFAIITLDKKMALAGITTIFHAISFEENDRKSRSIKLASEQIETINEINDRRLLIDNLIHLRFEICNIQATDIIKNLIDDKKINMFSIMNHSVGQGQFKTMESFLNYYEKHHGFSKEQAIEIAQRKSHFDKDKVLEIVEYAISKHIPTLSHDDDSIEKLDILSKMGIEMSEFPLSLEVATYAINKGLKTGMGAPNIVRGKSQSGNISAMELVKADVCSYLCSDYHPSSMLQSAYIISRETGRDLAKCFDMITKTPAKCAKLDDRGEIKVGKIADLIVIEDKDIPNVVLTMKNGKTVFSTLDFINHAA